MPITLVKTGPVASLAMVLNIPIKTSNGNNAEIYSFKNHKAGAGERKRRKSVMLINAAKQTETAAEI